MTELKPCPFCGAEAVVTKHHNRFTEWYLCSCPKCHISQTGSEYGFRFEAVEAWNRRVNDGKDTKEAETTQIIGGCCTACGAFMDCIEAADYKFCPYCAKQII